MPQRREHISRASEGSCEWFETDLYSRTLAKYSAESELEIEHLLNMMDLAEGPQGLPNAQYDAPIGWLSKIARRNPPWLAEIKSAGPEDIDGGHREYRLYFGEAPLDQQALLAALIEYKHTGWTKSVMQNVQTKHVKAAIEAIAKWCSSRLCDYRTRSG
ncbi:hypothetical protein QNA19_08800 [Rhodococcus fascians]|uniref:hypothetical protein n=1 Tax=Rhodococcoides fascians TaxID=1828 RepID=UPI0024B99437|nr:hypothetical protein [Rhodococcus fascians]MDJ0426014.1 hypothetical protein [Rhodococcus fascians]